MHYRRANTPGATYFFTVVTYQRQHLLDRPEGIGGQMRKRNFLVGLAKSESDIGGIRSTDERWNDCGCWVSLSLNPTYRRSAIAGAVAAGLVMVMGSVFVDWALIQIAIATVQTVTVYAAAFLLGATASISLNVRQFDIELACAIASLVYVWLAFKSLKAIIRSLKLASTTFFKGADLTEARFDQTDRTS